MEDRCRTVDPHPVGGPIILPEELTIGSGNTDERFGGELHILALPVEVDRDRRDVSRSRRSRTAEAAEAAARTTAATVSTAGSATNSDKTRIRHASLKPTIRLPNLAARIRK